MPGTPIELPFQGILVRVLSPTAIVLLAFAAAGGAIALALLPYGGPPDELQYAAHGVAFLVIGLLFAMSLPHRPWGGLAAAFLLSVGIEVAQVLVPGRSASLSDLAANLAGIAAAAVLYLTGRALKRWHDNRRFAA